MKRKDYIVPLCKVVYLVEDVICTSKEAILPTGDKEIDWSGTWNDRWVP